MSQPATICVTVLSIPHLTGADHSQGRCQLQVESTHPLPRAPYAGTVRVYGLETTRTGNHQCRMLKHFTIEVTEELPSGLIYQVTVDLADELPAPIPPPLLPSVHSTSYPSVHQPVASLPAIVAPDLGRRRVNEPLETICKRIAGIFGRYCEEFRAPSISVR